MLVHIARLGIAGLADDRLEARTVETAVETAERRIAHDRIGHVRIGNIQTHLAGALVERSLRHQLAEHLTVEAEGARLVHADGPPGLAAQLLQPVVVDRAELLDANFGFSHLGEGGEAETAENIADAPNGETEREQA